jgi:S-layer protein
MAYTSKQLTMAWTAVHDGIALDAASLADLQNRASQVSSGAMTDAQALSWVINSGDSTTALAVLSYQFFTGKSPSKVGIDYLVNSATNTNDLNDPYYAKFNLENRYINFAANLGLYGEGATAFATTYGTMSFAAFVASIYETIVGASYAKAAGLDAATSIAYIVGRQDAIKTTAQSAGMITPNMTPAQIDLAVKAAAAGFLLAEAIKADVGLYAAAANNFMLAVAQDKAVYNTDITKTYAPTGAQGMGRAVETAPELPGGPPKPPPVSPDAIMLSLGAGADITNGDDGDDIFTGNHTTFGAGDKLNGLGGVDTLKLVGTKGSTWTVPAATVTGFEIAEISNDAGLIVDTTTWTGLTTLKTTSVGATTLTAAATTDVTTTVTGQAANPVAVNGAHDVTVTSTGATTGTITVGGTVQPTGAVVVNRTTTGAGAAGTTTTTGGTSVNVTQTASNAVNTTQTNGAVTVIGTALTTSVTVKASPEATADVSTAGVVANTVTITDVNAGGPSAGTIAAIDVDGYSTLTINHSSLGVLKVAHGGGNVTINNAGATSPVTTLNLTTNGLTGGVLDDADVYTTLNVTTGAQASTLSDITDTALTTLSVGGASALTLTSVTGMTNLQTVTTSGAGGLVADLSSLVTVTAINTTASTGASTLMIDGTKTTFAGGAGGDTVTLSGTSITKAIDLGAGNDTLVLAAGTGTPAVAIDGGAGTADTLVMNNLDAIAAGGSTAFANKVTGFERLKILGGGISTADVGQLGGYHYVIASNNTGLTIKGLSSDDTVEFQNIGTFTGVDNANFGGANDSLNVRLTTPGGVPGIGYGRLGSNGIEHIAVTIVDTDAVAGVHIWRANDPGLKTITVTGNASLQLRLDGTALTSIDASALTRGGLSWITDALTGAATIKGSATGENTVTFSAATGGVITYEGGSGNDTVDAGNSLSGNIIHLGDGTNYFTGYGGATSAITAGSGDDYIRVDNGGATINAGNGSNRVLATDAIGSTITTGTGDDQIFVGGGANLVNVGSGNDYLEIGAVDAASATVFSAITGIGASDQVFVTTNHANVMGSKLTGQTTLAGYLALANDVAGTTNTLHWFEIGSDIYILSDVSDATTFVAGADSVVKLTGAAGLNLNAATVANGLITF